ncbi:MAG: urate hydroxylase PuuD [Bdellovibrio sp.]
MSDEMTNSLMFLLRWLHFFFGIIWIGHLYYFNFTQGAFMAEADAGTKIGVSSKLLPRALWWFRWGAMWTAVTGLLYMGLRGHQAKSFAIFVDNSWGIWITIGALLGLTMFANVWLIIWPNQQVVIKSAQQVAAGGQALPEAAAAGAKALLASRTNTLFSIPMLFFMGAASHLPLAVDPESSPVGLAFALAGIVWLLVEFNALFGKLGPLTTIRGVISSGFALTAILYASVAIVL